MSIFPTRILLATDGSKESGLAARTAVDLADRTNSELHIVYVHHHPQVPYAYDERHPEPEAPGGEEQALFERQVRNVEEGGGTLAGAHLRRGDPDAEIVAVAEELGAGLIVMGSRGHGGIRRALMGSVSDSVVRHAHCPVMVIRADDGR